jgi:hypothetical protein
MRNDRIKTLTLCYGQKCRIRDDCLRYRAEKHPQQPGAADFSQVAEFKPASPESCSMYLINKD